MRLFLAINFSVQTLAELQRHIDELRRQSRQGRFSRPENLHLTLVFLGECNEAEAALAESTMQSISFSGFDLEFDRLGRFKTRQGDLWWAGAGENAALLNLQSQLEAALQAAGFALQNREFAAHVTLGRDVKTSVSPHTIDVFGEPVRQVDLMLSKQQKGGVSYTPIASHLAMDC